MMPARRAGTPVHHQNSGGSRRTGPSRAILFARHAVAEPRKALALTTDQGWTRRVPSKGARKRTAVRVGVLAAGVLSLTGCTNDTFTRFGFPNPVTDQGKT